jgi:hypothetical protein
MLLLHDAGRDLPLAIDSQQIVLAAAAERAGHEA